MNLKQIMQMFLLLAKRDGLYGYYQEYCDELANWILQIPIPQYFDSC